MTMRSKPQGSAKRARGGGRPRTGSLYWTKSGWRARLTVEVDGVEIRKSVDLETTSKAAARVKLKRLLAEDAPTAESATRAETFREAAERIVNDSAIRTKARRVERLKLHVDPHIGPKPVDQITAGDVRDLLDVMVKAGQSRQSCVHVRNDVSAVLGEMWRAEMLPENVVAKVRIPKGAKVDRRERAVLTDEELARYLTWEHPHEGRRKAVLQRQTMACVARCFGGLRTADLHAIRWESFDVAEGAFTSGWAPRTKTARPQLLEVPAMLRPILRDWWERAARPETGPVFPVLRGEHAGEGRSVQSHAQRLRSDLMRAFGIEVPEAFKSVRSNTRTDTRTRWKVGREMTPRERELFEPTPFTLPVDFHSFRRAYKQALADAGVEIQTAMALSGANDAKAHQRYLANTSKMRELPAAALPRIGIARAETGKPAVANLNDSGCRRPDLNRRHRAYESGKDAPTSSNHAGSPFGRPWRNRPCGVLQGAHGETRCLNPRWRAWRPPVLRIAAGTAVRVERVGGAS